MRQQDWTRKLLILHISLLICSIVSANENLYRQAKRLQREGHFDKAIETYTDYLARPSSIDEITEEQGIEYTDALVQLMNTFQSKGAPEECVSTLKDIYKSSPLLKGQYLRDYYSVLGYALSRTEKMKEAEETIMKALSMQLYNPTPERYFRDYAYAAAVFYSNPEYRNEVIHWCHEALKQAQLSNNSSGSQWVVAMLGTLYKQNGHLYKAFELFHESKEKSESKKDNLAIVNSLHALTDLFLYWDIPEYADLYASEAIVMEKKMTITNPMISAQSYINKGRTLLRLGETDSISFYIEKARNLCESLPYNSGMVDVNLLNGIYLTESGGAASESGIQELLHVTGQGTSLSRAKAYHQLARTYLKQGKNRQAETMLDSLYALVSLNDSPNNIRIDYQIILNHYLKTGNHKMVQQFLQQMLDEEEAFKEKRLNFNLVEAVVDLKSAKSKQELKIVKLREANQRLWFMIFAAVFILIVSGIAILLFYEKRQHMIQMKKADEKLNLLMVKLNQSNLEKESVAQEIQGFLKDKDNRQELETLTPYILKEDGETKFRQCFELLYPLFLHRLREKVPAVTRREEILSMLIVLKQDNKKIAELLAIAPRSVLMLRHRFRQKIGMETEYSLENFIEDLLTE